MHSRALRLDFVRPTVGDLGALHRICSDPRVWTHFPSLRHDNIDATQAMLNTWQEDWDRNGLGTWMVRVRNLSPLIGYGGCILRGGGAFWNLGYRFAAESQGQGYATELAHEAVRQARQRNADLPVVASLVEHNTGSAKVAAKVGLRLRHRAPDAGNPDPDVIRLVYADRPLTEDQLFAVLR